MHACNTANAEHLQYLAEVLLSRQGRVDVLAFIPDQAQAGADNKSAADGDPATWERQLEAGVLAPMRLTASLAPDMAQRGRGAIIAAVWDPAEAELAGGAGEAAAKWGLTGWMHSCYESLRVYSISTTLVKIKGGREEAVAEAAEAFLLPFRLSPNCTPEELTVGSAEGSAAAAAVSEDVQPLLPEAPQQASAADGEMKGAYGGVVEATGARLLSGLMLRDAEPNEMGKAKTDTPGAVLTPSNPALLEPQGDHFYAHEPPRSPQLLVQCQKPFNGETPHALLAGAFVTPADIHFVRNHMPLPRGLSAAEHSITIEGPGVGATTLTLHDIRTKFKAHTFCSVLQCAGNRRSEMAAYKLVEGRAPWNSGGMGNARWTGALLRDVLASLWPQELDLVNPLNNRAKHVCFIGSDQHKETGIYYEGSIPLAKVLDPLGDVLLAYEMNGQELLPDHGYPVRAIVPGYVGARQVKWLSRIVLSENESEAPWQKKDYKLLPQGVTDHEGAEGPQGWTSMPAVEVMPVQSAILTPEAGSVFAASTTEAIKVRGYAWSGAGVPIARVDVSADGATWTVARFTASEVRPSGRQWAWTLWEADVPVPEESRKKAGPLRIMCKAMDAASNTQPEKVATVWNFRGLNCNSWGNTIVRLE
ncbi:sulfite mitochondrial [Chlorella sorokiniana]|uniref:Sulfite mitochondrial n=1 Tax=Chlorella sorokiniana TaxID=3076 RepID=A0A2P6TM47_CHLSO|nr:sulfite mitochondrial [Chlorella sorokiniana]|eukprot:PRW45406.1 sulfite mitochondrial [Chlorella sorokiniana]